MEKIDKLKEKSLFLNHITFLWNRHLNYFHIFPSLRLMVLSVTFFLKAELWELVDLTTSQDSNGSFFREEGGLLFPATDYWPSLTHRALSLFPTEK